METTLGGSWHLRRTPALDGIRGVAIVLVLICHTLMINSVREATTQLHAVGFAGLTVFFTLSGFLITTILVTERTGDLRVDLARFYWNRSVRLLPALALVVVVMLGLSRVIGIALAPSPVAVLLYVANWAQLAGARLGVLQPTWTLAIEEQFYLVWPLVLTFSARWRRGPVLVVTGGITVSLVLRLLLLVPSPQHAYYGSDTEASSLLVGCLLALVIARGAKIWRVPAPVAASAALLQILWLLLRSPGAADVLVPVVVPVTTCLMIVATVQGPVRTLSWRPLRYLGTRSYGIYLWHFAAIWMVKVVVGPSFLGGVVGLGIALLLAEGSWRLVETPARRLRRETVRSGESVRRGEAGPVTTTAAVAST